ncbi:MAG TPA: malonyl-ACP O-methyltransferase BioC [Candidatus Avirikenella pullistercoris]|nr:malonyl-ACP O-methyltransferase BioC [Candidatus Avirikenella pullistercoris]
MTLYNKKLIQKRFSAHLHTYNQYAVAQNEICARLSDILDAFAETPVKRAIEIGAGTGFLTRHLLKRFAEGEWFLNDIACEAEPFLADYVKESRIVNVSYLWGDAENIVLPRHLDLVATASTIQWFDDIEKFITGLDVVSGGILALSTFGTENFIEIREATGGEGLLYPSMEELKKWVEQAGYTILYHEDYKRILAFANPLEVLRHIKLTGVNGIRSVVWTREVLNRFCERYVKYFSCEGGVSLTYNPLILIARKVR